MPDTSEFTIGSSITLALSSSFNPYSFSFFDCQASSGGQVIVLFQGSCPNPSFAQKLNLVWLSHKHFAISVFRISGASNSMVFTCTVRVYLDDNELPADCNARKRREITRYSREAQNPSNTVSFRMNIADAEIVAQQALEEAQKEKEKNDGSSAASISTNLALGFF